MASSSSFGQIHLSPVIVGLIVWFGLFMSSDCQFPYWWRHHHHGHGHGHGHHRHVRPFIAGLLDRHWSHHGHHRHHGFDHHHGGMHHHESDHDHHWDHFHGPGLHNHSNTYGNSNISIVNPVIDYDIHKDYSNVAINGEPLEDVLYDYDWQQQHGHILFLRFITFIVFIWTINNYTIQ